MMYEVVASSIARLSYSSVVAVESAKSRNDGYSPSINCSFNDLFLNNRFKEKTNDLERTNHLTS